MSTHSLGKSKITTELKKNKTPWLMITPAIALLLLMTVFPLLYSLYLSLNDWNLARPQYGMVFIGLDNFRQMFRDTYFWQALLRTGYFVLGTVSLEMIVGCALALLFESSKKSVMRMRSLLLFPVMLSPIVVGVIWRILYHPSFGMINLFTQLLGLGTKAWLGDPRTAMLAVIGTEVWQWSPFVMLLVLSGLSGISKEAYEAAAIDGASKWQVFWRVTLPLLAPMLAIAALLRLIDGVRSFDTIYVMTKGGPSNFTETLSFLTYKQGFMFFNLGKASALSYILLILVIILSQVFVRAKCFQPESGGS